MKRRAINWNLIKYEIRNIIGNIFTVFFGVIFPIVMSLLISQTYKSQVPKEVLPKMMTGIFITMSLISPMAIILIGYSANYSQEIEKEIPLRLRLFGYSEKSLLISKLIAYMIFTIISLLIYSFINIAILDIQTPKLSALISYMLSLFIITVIFFILAHGLAMLLRKYGPTYAVTMILYFAFMIVCGMMGVKVNQLPEIVQSVAYTLPMTYISTDFVEFWEKGNYNFGPLFLSTIFLGIVSLVILFFGIKRSNKIKK